MVDFFVEMLKINSVNPRMDGPGEKERAGFIESFLKSEGLPFSVVEVPDPGYTHRLRPNISTVLSGTDKSRTLWFLAHMDTVPEGSRDLWKSDPFDPVVKDGKIYARGAEDNGQSLVASLFAIRELNQLGRSLPFNVGAWFVADEEFGSEYGVKYLLNNNYFKPNDLVIVPDAGTPEGDVIEIAEKNLVWFKIAVIGKQVHGSRPNHGKNAHRIGMKLSLSIDKILHEKYTAQDPSFDVPFSTFEPTKIEANVPNINTVPGLDVFYYDCRVLPGYSLDNVLSDIKGAIEEIKANYHVEANLVIINREDAGDATEQTSEVAVLLSKAISTVAKKKPRFEGIGGQTVGNLFRKKGLPTVVWSTIADIPHEPNEYSIISNLLNDAKVFASVPLLAT